MADRMGNTTGSEDTLMGAVEVKFFVDVYDDRASLQEGPEDHAVREERHLAAVLHAQVQEFVLGLESALATRVHSPLNRSQMLGAAMRAASEVGLETDEGSPHLLDMFSFMSDLSAFPHDARYSAGFAPDGSVTIVTGPELPSFDEVGIGGSTEHDARDLKVALAVARECTRLAAELKFRLVWGANRPRLLDSPPRVHETQDPVGPIEASGPDDRGAAPAADSSGDELAGFLAELGHVADDHFRIWSGGSEAEWASFALGILADRGLIAAHGQDGRALSLARLMTLWALHLEFTARSGEGTPGDWAYVAGEWVDDGISSSELRRLDALLKLGWEIDEDEEIQSEFCNEVIRSQRSQVVGALVSKLGDSAVFASMWATRLETSYPLDGELFHDIVNTDIDGDKQSGYMWVDSGMEL